MKIRYSLGIIFILSGIFLLDPQWDLIVSHYFYHSDFGFLWQNSEAVVIIRKIILNTIWIFNLGLVVILLVRIFRPKFIDIIKTKTAIFIVLSFVFAQGLVVNEVLKDHWGRPRPREIVEFGGEKVFQKIWVISNQCSKNCSFTSGDAAAVFGLYAFVPFVRRKKLMTAVVSVFGLSMGFFRMAEGAHFLSDVLFSGFIVYTVIALLHTFFYSPFHVRARNTVLRILSLPFKMISK